MRVVLSSSAAVRLAAARRFVLDAAPDTEFLVAAASRAAADDFARAIARTRGATFGMYRFSVTQLAARLAGPLLARDRLSPTTPLGVQAVAARALFDATRDGALSYFAPVATAPGFPRALARTLEEVSLAMVPAAAIRGLGDGGGDLAALLERFDEQFDAASAVDRSRFLSAAARAVAEHTNPYAHCRLLLLDVPVANATERTFVEALVARAPAACATTPKGDDLSRDALAGMGSIEDMDSSDVIDSRDSRDSRNSRDSRDSRDSDDAGAIGDGSSRGPLARVRRNLFSLTAPPPAEPLDEVELFSAPGEGRECVEIARRVLREARRGVPFDRIAIALRAPQHYAGLLEHALERAGIPAYFERGTRRPHPAGRAFLALLRCAADNLSARRFAEYLSLGQVPEAGHSGADTFPSSNDEVFGVAGERAETVGRALSGSSSEEWELDQEGGPDKVRPTPDRAPWKWERLLAESRVIATEQRWERRLSGLVHECELQQQELTRTEPGSPRIDHLTRKIDDIHQLESFALPLMRTLGGWPARATWGEWLERFGPLASRVLKQPDRVLRVLADLSPMGAIGPIGLDEAADVLAWRLASIEAEPPARRYGRVLVTTPTELRGRSFEVGALRLSDQRCRA